MRPHRVRQTLGAFTLIEMLIVISIISVLLGLLYGALERAQKFSRRTITFSELKGIEAAFKQYHAHYHAWPSNGLVNASSRLTSGQDEGFLIDASIARALQGSRETSSEVWKMNPEAVPFIEFSRFSPLSRNPVNPFKPQRNVATDTTRSYKVLFDTNGDRQIEIPGSDTDATASPSTNIVASVAVWTIIPSTRTSDNSAGTAEEGEEIRFGSWDSFSVK
jgi:prepilin-type N-terminal cleavage/methylation domain-containing protein